MPCEGSIRSWCAWALDRLSRQGPQATLEVVSPLGKYGCQVVGLQEPWTEMGGEMLDLLLSIFGWVARMESQRRSERTRAGLARVRASGKVLGRPKGSKDTKRRRGAGTLPGMRTPNKRLPAAKLVGQGTVGQLSKESARRNRKH